MKLVIAEKPSAAQSYAKALNITAKKSGYFEGNGYYLVYRTSCRLGGRSGV